jgi:glycerol-3-phosphate O-acyltransferase / dihydroxyacetone phosphate acyltransferase
MRLFGLLFYRYLWISLNILLFWFYKFRPRKHVTGYENIPKDKPVLFCSNHPNAFMDAVLLGATIKRRSWFLARSDVFRKKRLARFLSFIGIVPIYRLMEGAENLSKNDETFDRCAAMLEENKAIMIFSEGLCVQERRLRKLKKGTARIAFGAEEKNKFLLDLMIVPVGLNYSATPWKFRSGFHVRFGKPFAVKDYQQLYEQDKPRAMNQFTRDLENKMRELLVVIEHKENDELIAQIEEMQLDERAKVKSLGPDNTKDTHLISCEIANEINAKTNADPEAVKTIREKAATYFGLLKKYKIRDWLLSPDAKQYSFIGDAMMLLVLSPLWIFGIITNYIPYKIPWLIQKKIVKNMEWSASVNATIGVFLWQFYWLLQSLVVALVFRNWYLLFAFMIAVPISGITANFCWIILRKMKGCLRLNKMREKEVEELKSMRTEIETAFGEH